MSDLISRQDAINKINERQRKLIYCFGFENDMVKIMNIAKSIITALPSAQPETNEGHWILRESYYGDEQYECSQCGVIWEFSDGTPKENDSYYCPHCGAKMIGVHNEEIYD